MSLHRHEAIAPLSRHHHYALRLVLKIQKLDPHPALETMEQLKQEIREFWNTGGQAHFREEEEILLPAYARFAPIDRQEMIDILLEHVRIRSVIDEIEQSTDPDETVALVRKLGEWLEEHVRKEERIVFPLIEAALPEAELQRLAPYFHEFHTDCEL